jgi:hypothetical protein
MMSRFIGTDDWQVVERPVYVRNRSIPTEGFAQFIGSKSASRLAR